FLRAAGARLVRQAAEVAPHEPFAHGTHGAHMPVAAVHREPAPRTGSGPQRLRENAPRRTGAHLAIRRRSVRGARGRPERRAREGPTGGTPPTLVASPARSH